MKKIINYEKDILFKTNIGEICSICLEHDFTVDDGVLRGEFILSGEYKANELSINKDPFMYRLPLEYELEPTCDVDTLSYDIDNFEYTTNADELSVYIDFGIRYEEKANEPIIPSITEDELNSDEEGEYELPKMSRVMMEDDEVNEPEVIEAPKVVDEDGVTVEEMNEERLDAMDEGIILESTSSEDEYMVYHVHIVREGDTLDTIANQYNSNIEVIKKYNNIETLEYKSKLIIPECDE